MHEFIIVLISAAFGGGLIGFVQFLIQRKDNNMMSKLNRRFDKLDVKIEGMDKQFNTKIDELRGEIENESVKNARIRILNFSEDVMHGNKRSKESYGQVYSDIDDYKTYCKKHPDYPNSKADAAIRHIEHLYEECMRLEEAGEEGFLS